MVLDHAEWSRLLPPGDVRVGDTWELDQDVTAKMLKHFFPPTENTEVSKNRIDEQSLHARVDSIEQGRALAIIEGRLKMKHSFYHADDNNCVEAELKGYLEIDVQSRRLQSFRLVTNDAKYGGRVNGVQSFGVALQLMPVEAQVNKGSASRE